MSINPKDDYESLAKLLYPSIEASGNVYYGQTRKLTMDEVFDKNGIGFESHIESEKRSDGNYNSYFVWNLGPLHGQCRIYPEFYDGSNPHISYRTLSGSSNTLKLYNAFSNEEIEVTSATSEIGLALFLKYKLEFNDIAKNNVTSAGSFKTYSKDINLIEQSGLHASTATGIFPDRRPADGRNFCVVQESDGLYLYVCVVSPEINLTPLCFTAETAGSTVALNMYGDLSCRYQYSKDGVIWQDYGIGTSIELLNKGDIVYFKGHRSNQDDENYLQFSMTGTISASGNANSLLDENNYNSITDLSNYGYYTFYRLFAVCESLTSAPKLPATELAEWCYDSMFAQCAGLTQAPELPATTLVTGCYNCMFAWCTSLTSAPELPATELVEGCYCGMFMLCGSLEHAPELPAMELDEYCYSGMFMLCGSLEHAPELPAMELDEYCYSNMFSGCSRLTSAPELPATTLAPYCYQNMFSGCTLLNEIKCCASSGFANTGCLTGWLTDCADSGVIYTEYGDGFDDAQSAIPEGWECVPSALCFTAEEAGSSVTLNIEGSLEPVGPEYSAEYKYSENGFAWTDYDIGTTIQLTNIGSKVYFKGHRPELNYNDENYLHFTMTGKIAASGNVNSLIDSNYHIIRYLDLGNYGNFNFYSLFADCKSLTSAPKLPATTLSSNCYQCMFRGCDSLISAPELPATELAHRCYYDMFSECYNLTSAPELPAEQLVHSCYKCMFYGCESLTSAPELPATELAEGCYDSMFNGCKGLTSAPELPATELDKWCYFCMFSGCESLTQAPDLPATELTDNCYNCMFYGCKLLSSVKCYATDIAAFQATNNWLYDVSPTGTFYKNANVTWPRSDSGIPSTGWAIEYIDYSSTDTIEFDDIKCLFNLSNNDKYSKHYKLDVTSNGSRSTASYNSSNLNTVDKLSGSYNQEIWGYKQFNDPVNFNAQIKVNAMPVSTILSANSLSDIIKNAPHDGSALTYLINTKCANFTIIEQRNLDDPYISDLMSCCALSDNTNNDAIQPSVIYWYTCASRLYNSECSEIWHPVVNARHILPVNVIRNDNTIDHSCIIIKNTGAHIVSSLSNDSYCNIDDINYEINLIDGTNDIYNHVDCHIRQFGDLMAVLVPQAYTLNIYLCERPLLINESEFSESKTIKLSAIGKSIYAAHTFADTPLIHNFDLYDINHVAINYDKCYQVWRRSDINTEWSLVYSYNSQSMITQSPWYHNVGSFKDYFKITPMPTYSEGQDTYRYSVTLSPGIYTCRKYLLIRKLEDDIDLDSIYPFDSTITVDEPAG